LNKIFSHEKKQEVIKTMRIYSNIKTNKIKENNKKKDKKKAMKRMKIKIRQKNK
jgi:hypothetical protein